MMCHHGQIVDQNATMVVEEGIIVINFDFNRHSEAELIELNRKIVEHIKLRRQRESQQAMDRFDLGETVCFKNREGRIVEGKIISFNKKTVTIERGDCGHRWRVSPQLLEKVVDQKRDDRVVVINQSNVEVYPSEKFAHNASCPCGSGKKFKRCCMGKLKKVNISMENFSGNHFQ